MLTYKAFIEEDGCLKPVTSFYGLPFPVSHSLEDIIRGVVSMREQLVSFYIHERDMDAFNRVTFIPVWNLQSYEIERRSVDRGEDSTSDID